MDTPFISFIVPVYNVEDYLHECVDSIIGQNCGDWELILIDDGSPDRCPQICDEYAAKDNRIKVIHQKNAGVAAARNAGLDVAQGEWIWFVDSDDWVAGEAVEILKSRIGGINCDFVMFGFTIRKGDMAEKTVTGLIQSGDKKDFLSRNICFHNQRILFRRELIENMDTTPTDQVMFGYVRHECGCAVTNEETNDQGSEKQDFLNRHTAFFNPCMIFKNDIIRHNKLRFTEGIRLAEDLEFQYKYEMLCYRPMAINEALYQYRIREGSVTHTDTYRCHAIEDIIKVLRNLLVFIKENKIKSESWLNKRIEMLMKNLLYSASLVKKMNISGFQRNIRSIINAYRQHGFTCFDGKKIRLAYFNVRLYFIANKIYLKIKGLS